MVWPDLRYDHQSHDPLGRPRRTDAVAFDQQLHDYYRQLIHLRRDTVALRRGAFRVLAAADDTQTLAFMREGDGPRVLVALNRSQQPRTVVVPLDELQVREADVPGSPRLVSSGAVDDVRLDVTDGQCRVRLPAVTGVVVVLAEGRL
jgi:hypothetical protein